MQSPASILRTSHFGRQLRRLTAALSVVLAILVPAGALAVVQLFADVPPSNPFFTNIQDLALSGVTSGCGGGNYCPTDPVTREQMAAFLNRGLGRVAYTDLSPLAIPTAETPTWKSFTITTGLPGSTVSGAKQFIKADADITVSLTSATGCPCTFRGALFVTGVGYMVGRYTDVTLTTVGELKVLAMTGAVGVTTIGSKTVEVRMFRISGSGAADGYGNATAIVLPFGSTGSNVLRPAAQKLPTGATSTNH
jgi:hypothetical protein